MNKLTTGLLALFCPVFVWAQNVPEPSGEAEIRRFTAEVIIFRYAEDVGVGSEVFLPDEPDEPGTGGALDALEGADAGSGFAGRPGSVSRAARAALPAVDLVPLDEARFELRETYERLERLDAYEPLMHFGWTQTTWPQEQTEAIPLHMFGRPPAALDGSLMLYLGRYLHLVVDLQLRAPDDDAAAARPASGFDRFATSIGVAEGLPPRPVYFRIREDRILRTGELRYFDHPKFGLLARVARVEADDEPGQGELLGYPIQ